MRSSSRTTATQPANARELRELALDLARLVDLHDVALLDVLVVLERDAALVAGRDLAHVVLHAPQRADPAVIDHGAVAHEPHARAAGDLAVAHVGAGDGADARGLEDLQHLED